MRWFVSVLILLILVNIGISIAMWADIAIINDNLFLIYDGCVPGEES